MKKLCAFLLMALLMVPVWAGADDSDWPDKQVVTDDGLALLSPSSFFDGKYSYFNEVDNEDTGSTWITFFFRLNYDATYDEVKADAERYRQSLVNSGYFVQRVGKSEHNMAYIGGRTVASAMTGGKEQGWHVNVNTDSGWASMDIPPSIRVNLVKGFYFSDIAHASKEEAPVATEKPKSAAKSKSTTSQIAWDDGLNVMSPEQYLGIKPCDHIYQQDNWYCYEYTNRGYKWYRHGTNNPVDWYKMKEYVDALVASGYYEILEYDMPYSDQEYWCLDYIGPGKVTKTFGVNRNTTQRAAIIVQSNLGDISVYFSLDITAHDLDETQKRLGTDIFVKNNNDGPSILPTCDACNGSGDCTYCWGRGTDGITGRDCAVCDRGNCSYCHGSGHK